MAVFKPIILLILSSLLLSAHSWGWGSDDGICKKLHVGSKIGSTETFNDIVADGVVADRWNSKSPITNIVGPYKTLEYFYLADVDFKLTSDHLLLSVDQPDHVKSEVILKKEHTGWYTVEVNYKCDVYGGVIIAYKLDIEVPKCGRAEISWRKLCGNPYAERAGFTMEMSFVGYNEVIVRNGKPVLAYYFDKDVDNYAMMVPADAEIITFTMYINSSDVLASNETQNVHSFAPIPMSPDKKVNNMESFVGKMSADADQVLLDIKLSGELATHGGYVNNITKQVVTLELTCKGWESMSTVEVDIPVYHFKQVALYFLKKCEGTPQSSGGFFWGLIKYSFYIFLALMAYSTYLNVKEQGHFSWQTIPYAKPGYDYVVDLINNQKILSAKLREDKPAYSRPQTQRTGFEQEMDDKPSGIHVDDDANTDFNFSKEHEQQPTGAKYGAL